MELYLRPSICVHNLYLDKIESNFILFIVMEIKDGEKKGREYRKKYSHVACAGKTTRAWWTDSCSVVCKSSKPTNIQGRRVFDKVTQSNE